MGVRQHTLQPRALHLVTQLAFDETELMLKVDAKFGVHSLMMWGRAGHMTALGPALGSTCGRQTRDKSCSVSFWDIFACSAIVR